ncbi:phage tail protein I [Novosphingobium pentaromativorans]|uniref:Phage-related tail protein n=1 Tax=Novosphingobium pentaromativorans US6-1 TaxID=1088721 RepID=G6EFI1_9SPHN|nr:phage tail protein I [Novosphingobium pentaromativorans]AIT79105.1 tail protein [Novosphingobium pentaromativorans US6-1]EHJ59929.1 phage-related tail protein [Novosphingobium pentaromativorans US6-1]
MTYPSLLPLGSTPLEAALEQVGATRLDIATAIRSVWSPDDCPIELLPWLAWGLSLDNWSTSWPEGIKRERVRQAISIARRKGTAESVRAVIASFGGSVAIREWWQSEPKGDPHTFSLVLNLDHADAPASAAFVDQVIAEVSRAKPVRSTFTFTQGINTQAGVGLVAAVRPTIFARLSCTAPAAT